MGALVAEAYCSVNAALWEEESQDVYLKIRVGSEGISGIRCWNRSRSCRLLRTVAVTLLNSSTSFSYTRCDGFNRRGWGRSGLFSYDIEGCRGEDWIWCCVDAIDIDFLRSGDG